MQLNAATWATLALVGGGAIIATPALYRAFSRRGSGVYYEKNFLIQRAPQYSTLLNVILTLASFIASNKLFESPLNEILSPIIFLNSEISNLISIVGILVLISGLVFMIGGWYSLGECFSTDAEVLDGHKVRKDGLLKFVMHPAYSGIIQSVLGASIAAGSPFAILFTLFIVAPLWLNRAKYEENLLLQSLGQEYKAYAEEMKWRRLIPKCFPIGV